MGDIYEATIEAWPHQSDKGAEADRAAAGEREQTFDIVASDMDDALSKANLVSRGMRSNPAVWQAPVTCVRRKREP